MPEHHTHTYLQTAILERNKEWQGATDLSASFRINELLGEVGELCNVIKKLERERLGIRGSRDTLEHLAEELGDGVICLMLVANEFNLKVLTEWHYTDRELPTDYALDLGIALGRLCEEARANHANATRAQIMKAMGALRGIAVHYGLDLDQTAASKFNQTTRKLGLSHFVREGMAA